MGRHRFSDGAVFFVTLYPGRVLMQSTTRSGGERSITTVVFLLMALIATACSSQDVTPDALTITGMLHNGEQQLSDWDTMWNRDVDLRGNTVAVGLTWNLFEGRKQAEQDRRWRERQVWVDQRTSQREAFLVGAIEAVLKPAEPDPPPPTPAPCLDLCTSEPLEVSVSGPIELKPPEPAKPEESSLPPPEAADRPISWPEVWTTLLTALIAGGGGLWWKRRRQDG